MFGKRDDEKTDEVETVEKKITVFLSGEFDKDLSDTDIFQSIAKVLEEGAPDLEVDRIFESKERKTRPSVVVDFDGVKYLRYGMRNLMKLTDIHSVYDRTPTADEISGAKTSEKKDDIEERTKWPIVVVYADKTYKHVSADYGITTLDAIAELPEESND